MSVFQARRTSNGMERIPMHHKQVEPKPSAAIIMCTTEGNICMVTKTRKVSKKEYIWSGTTVFPGGLLHSGADGQFVDYCRKYYSKWFEKYEFSYDDAMYRLNALRELFEETGILLCRSKESIFELSKREQVLYPIKASMFEQHDGNTKLDMVDWRHKVMNDPYQFQRLFESINMIPDIISLLPWARILTPWFVSSKRWDARFYLALIEQKDIVGMASIGNQTMNALGKEIIRIDWLAITEAVGPKKSEKSKNIPMITEIQLLELLQIIQVENCLFKEWTSAYYHRNICVFKPKMVVKMPENNPIMLFPGDYLYHQVVDYRDVECDSEKENNPKYLQRSMTSRRGWKKVFRVLNQQNRLYSYLKQSKL